MWLTDISLLKRGYQAKTIKTKTSEKRRFHCSMRLFFLHLNDTTLRKSFLRHRSGFLTCGHIVQFLLFLLFRLRFFKGTLNIVDSINSKKKQNLTKRAPVATTVPLRHEHHHWALVSLVYPADLAIQARAIPPPSWSFAPLWLLVAYRVFNWRPHLQFHYKDTFEQHLYGFHWIT